MFKTLNALLAIWLCRHVIWACHKKRSPHSCCRWVLGASRFRMGSSCSATSSESPTGCARFSESIGRCEEQCDPCGSDTAPDLSSEHPLIRLMQQEMDAPPWAAVATYNAGSQPRRDRTATGATPPRSPAPVKTVPPGLPEEEAQESAMALAGSFGAEFLQELFREARQGDAARMSGSTRKIHVLRGAVHVVVDHGSTAGDS